MNGVNNSVEKTRDTLMSALEGLEEACQDVENLVYKSGEVNHKLNRTNQDQSGIKENAIEPINSITELYSNITSRLRKATHIINENLSITLNIIE